MKNNNLPLIIGGIAAALGIGYVLTSNGGGKSGGKANLVLPRLAPTPTKTLTVIAVDTNGVVREVIPQVWAGQTSMVELTVINAKTGVPVAEALAFSRDSYDFKTLPTEVSDLLNTYFNVKWAA